MRQRILQRPQLGGTRLMLLLQTIDQRCRRRETSAESFEQIRLFLGMVKLLRKGIDVMEHRVQQFEIRLDCEIADFTHDVEHAAQHGRKRAVLVCDDAYRLQWILSG